jgi:hypothetical protein
MRRQAKADDHLRTFCGLLTTDFRRFFEAVLMTSNELPQNVSLSNNSLETQQNPPFPRESFYKLSAQPKWPPPACLTRPPVSAVTFITGCATARSIGRATALLLAKNGAAVV